ncbi:unnamed protein product, partial [Closterium sp. NIES-54]
MAPEDDVMDEHNERESVPAQAEPGAEGAQDHVADGDLLATETGNLDADQSAGEGSEGNDANNITDASADNDNDAGGVDTRGADNEDANNGVDGAAEGDEVDARSAEAEAGNGAANIETGSDIEAEKHSEAADNQMNGLVTDGAEHNVKQEDSDKEPDGEAKGTDAEATEAGGEAAANAANGVEGVNGVNGVAMTKKEKEAEKRRRRKKQKKKSKAANKGTVKEMEEEVEDEKPKPVLAGVQVEYVTEKPEIEGEGFEDFLKIFEKFATVEEPKEEEKEDEEKGEKKKKADSDDEDDDEEEEDKEKGVSNKERKMKNRMKVGELKQICARPEVVEVWDPTASDPRLLVFLKAYRNTVPVPRHWSQKRKYLQVPPAFRRCRPPDPHPVRTEPDMHACGLALPALHQPGSSFRYTRLLLSLCCDPSVRWFRESDGIRRDKTHFRLPFHFECLRPPLLFRSLVHLPWGTAPCTVLNPAVINVSLFFLVFSSPVTSSRLPLLSSFLLPLTSPPILSSPHLLLSSFLLFLSPPPLLHSLPRSSSVRASLIRSRSPAHHSSALMWSHLQGKRGIEKPVWQLPDFIAATGIEKLRQAYAEKEDSKKMKQKQRDRMQPKMGKMDIDYQVLHDAFFKYQTKPKLTYVGDLYYEGKEFESKTRDYKPGHLSSALKNALGMTDGNSPPPWLINMQRYGPPPSYPHMKIPGLNAPIPAGASFGYQPGGWGKPPVDE